MKGIIHRLILLTALFQISSCAVLDSDLPAWSEYRSPDSENTIELASKSYGQGPTVLLIHGFGASSYSWRYVVPELSKSFHVITLDLKGFGESPKPRDDKYSVYEQAHLVRSFILRNQFKDLILVGHSYGGGVALATAIYLKSTHPELIRKLVLIDSMAYRQDLPIFVEIIATPVLGGFLMTVLPETLQIRRLLKEVYLNDSAIPPEAIEHYARELEQDNAKYAALTGARQIIPSDIEQLSAQYPELHIPTLLIWGREDDIIPLSIGERLLHDLPDACLFIVDKVGHAPQEEKPNAILPRLLEFVSSKY